MLTEEMTQPQYKENETEVQRKILWALRPITFLDTSTLGVREKATERK